MRLVCVRLRKSLCAYRRRSCLGCVCMRACGSMSAVCVRACAYVHLHVCAYVCARAYAQTHVRAFVRGSVRGGAVAHISRSASMKRVWMSFTNSSERYSEIGTRLLKRIRDVTNLCIRRVHVCACVCACVRASRTVQSSEPISENVDDPEVCHVRDVPAVLGTACRKPVTTARCACKTAHASRRRAGYCHQWPY